MKKIKLALYVITVLIFSTYSKLMAQKKYYNKSQYARDTCEVKYNKNSNALVLYSRNDIDTLYLEKNETVKIKQLHLSDDNMLDVSVFQLLINGKLIYLKNGLRGFEGNKEKCDIKFSHGSHLSHYSQVR